MHALEQPSVRYVHRSSFYRDLFILTHHAQADASIYAKGGKRVRYQRCQSPAGCLLLPGKPARYFARAESAMPGLPEESPPAFTCNQGSATLGLALSEPHRPSVNHFQLHISKGGENAMHSRRSLMKGIVGLPIAGAMSQFSAFASSTSINSSVNQAVQEGKQSSYDRKCSAVKVIRFITGAQQQHLQAAGRYATLAELASSQALKQFVAGNVGERATLGRVFYEQLRFDRDEILPGWGIDLKVGKDGLSYVVALKDVSSDRLGSFSSNQGGMIYQGKTSPMHASSVWSAKDLLVGKAPIFGSGEGFLDLI
jgi:hypothetical protein